MQILISMPLLISQQSDNSQTRQTKAFNMILTTSITFILLSVIPGE